MAGDHKCPVCSSTFTRPQHVARHMRSHTGDRPYKCQHCGDQFARSDLLSRHVNKCHASEKPPTTTQPARRKGHAQPGSSSAGGVRGPAPSLIPPPGSRKVCDPCAHSRTPAQCDSGLPCGKCLQRNTKCIYAKAHETSRRPPGTMPHARPDLFVPPPTVPSMAPATRPATSDTLFPTQSSFNFTVPIYPQSLDPNAATAYPSGAFDASPSLAAAQSVEYSLASYPDSAEMLKYSSMYSHDWPQSSNHEAAFTDQALAFPQGLGYPDPHKSGLDTFLDGSYGAGNNFLYNHSHSTEPHHPQRDAQTDYAFSSQSQQHPGQPDPQFTSGLPNTLHGPGIPGVQSQSQASSSLFALNHEGGFSSAFGLMSLDDPALAAEMKKHASFFAPADSDSKLKDSHELGGLPTLMSSNGLPMPMTMPLGATTPGRDANVAELRDFWKAFMRTPGEKTPGGLAMLNGHASSSTHPDGGHSDHERPSLGMRRSLSKMASLPDIKTPPLHADGGGRQGNGFSLGPGRGEDLRSYELAVLARQAPSLTLAPRRRATLSNEGSGSDGMPSQGQGQGQMRNQQFQAPYPPQQQQQQRKSPHVSTASSSPQDDNSPAASVSSIASAPAASAGRRGSTTAAAATSISRRERPSFKRIASQTLGPFESKTAKVSHQHSGDTRLDAIAQYESDGASRSRPGTSHSVESSASGRGSPSSEYPSALYEPGRHRPEHRRLSAPTTSATRPMFLPQ
ncbi:hypothetical protein K439DRAFT_269714 [Ramaria rubella]|nr:hypothetical protein K439DRAFT_269714 [Ramaria rubella]